MHSNTSHLEIDAKLQWLNDRNSEYSDLFLKDAYSRIIYQKQYPTSLAAFKCMDGRVHVPAVTNTPFGIIKPFRRLGGIFDLGWPFLGEKFFDWLMQQIKEAKKSIVLITYHYSKGSNQERGCAGFDCNLEAALDFTKSFKIQIERIFGTENPPLYPLIVGLETDEDGFIFHNNGNRVQAYDMLGTTEANIQEQLNALYHDIPQQVVHDLMPLVLGNIKHVQQVRASGRPVIESEHREWIVGIGSGFDWLHAPNTALIIGPWSPRFDIDIQKAFSIVRKNMKEGRISDDGFVLMISSEYLDLEKSMKIEKVNFLKNYALDILNQDEFSDLRDKVKIFPVIVDEHNKKFENVQTIIDKIPYVKWY